MLVSHSQFIAVVVESAVGATIADTLTTREAVALLRATESAL